jgi:hypothetical protein
MEGLWLNALVEWVKEICDLMDLCMEVWVGLQSLVAVLGQIY